MAAKRSRRSCPACEARLSRVDFGTRWPRRGKLVLLAAMVVTGVWAPLFFFLVGAPMLEKPSRLTVLIVGAVALGPGLGIASFAGRREAFARCRGCGWDGLAADVSRG